MVSISHFYDMTMNFYTVYLTWIYAVKFIMLRFYNTKIQAWVVGVYSGLLLGSWHENLKSLFTQFFLILTFKLSCELPLNGFKLYHTLFFFFLLLTFFVSYLARFNTLNHKEMQTIWMTSMFLFLSLVNFLYIDNFVILIFSLEVITIIYFFFFLTHLPLNKNSFIRYKNLISYYLWSSFIVLVSFSAAIFYLVYAGGTLQFKEVSCLITGSFQPFWYVILVSTFWKVGAPGFHFFKLELYQYLSSYSLLMFSIYSLFINYFILVFIIFSFYPALIVSNAYIMCYLFIFNIFLLSRASLIDSFYRFLGLSSVNTWAVLLFFGLI